MHYACKNSHEHSVLSTIEKKVSTEGLSKGLGPNPIELPRSTLADSTGFESNL